MIVLLGAGFWSVSAVTDTYLGFVEAEIDNSGGADGINGSWSVEVSPDGRHVYVVGSIGDAVAVFARDTADQGKLTFLQAYFDGSGGVDGLNKATDVAISPDNMNVYVTGRDDDALAVFTRDTVSGMLTFEEQHRDGAGGVDGLDGAYAVTVSPDNKNVYVTGENDSAVTVFARSLISGTLTFMEVHKDGVGGVTGLGVTREIVVSPDGAFVYVVNGANTAGDGAVVTFSRDTTTGALTFVEAVMDDAFGTTPALSGASSVAISGDGRYLYVASRIDDAVTVFRRDPDTGRLFFVQQLEATIGGTASISSLNGATALDITPDDKTVIVGSDLTDTLHVFVRNPTTGLLFLVETHVDNMAGVDGLEYIKAVNVSPDGDNCVRGRFCR